MRGRRMENNDEREEGRRNGERKEIQRGNIGKEQNWRGK